MKYMKDPEATSALGSIASLERIARSFKYYLLDIENLRTHLKEEFEKNLPDTDAMKDYFRNIDGHLSDAHSDLSGVASLALQQAVNGMADEVLVSKTKDDGCTE